MNKYIRTETYKVDIGEVDVTIKFVVCIFIYRYIKRDIYRLYMYE